MWLCSDWVGMSDDDNDNGCCHWQWPSSTNEKAWPANIVSKTTSTVFRWKWFLTDPVDRKEKPKNQWLVTRCVCIRVSSPFLSSWCVGGVWWSLYSIPFCKCRAKKNYKVKNKKPTSTWKYFNPPNLDPILRWPGKWWWWWWPRCTSECGSCSIYAI